MEILRYLILLFLIKCFVLNSSLSLTMYFYYVVSLPWLAKHEKGNEKERKDSVLINKDGDMRLYNKPIWSWYAFILKSTCCL